MVSPLTFELPLATVMAPCETRVTEAPLTYSTQSPQTGAETANVPAVLISRFPVALTCKRVSAELLLVTVMASDE